MRHLGKIAFASASLICLAAACGGGDDSAANNGSDASTGPGPLTDLGGAPLPLPTTRHGSVASVVAATATGLPDLPAVTVPSGFKMEVIARVDSARELAALPNGDLLVATNGGEMDIVPNAEADGLPGKSVKFADALDNNPAGVFYNPT